MLGWKIFVHSFRMVFGNFGVAVRLSGVLYLVIVLSNILFMRRFGADLAALQTGQSPQPEFWLGWGLFATVSVTAGLWIAVTWHRYVLFEETPKAVVPPFNGARIMAYFGRSVQLALVLVGVGMGFLLIASVLSTAFGGTVRGLGALMSILVMGAMLYLFYRLSPVLPAAALGKNMTFRQALVDTRPASAAFIQLIVIAMIAGAVGRVLRGSNVGVLAPVNLIMDLLDWAYMMIGISILTTIYGHYIEKRGLSVK